MDFKETQEKKSKQLSEYERELLEDILLEFDLPDKPDFTNAWSYKYSHPVFILNNYVVSASKFGNKQAAGMTIEQATNNFFEITNQIRESVKNYQLAGVPIYFKTKNGDYFLRKEFPFNGTFFKDKHPEQKPVITVRKKSSGPDIQELIGNFLISGEESLNNFLINELQLNEDELMKMGFKGDYLGFIVGQVFKLIHQPVNKKDEYLPEHERRLMEVYSKEFVSKAMSNYVSTPTLTIFDPRLRNMGLSNKDGLLYLDLFDTDSSRIASPAVDVYFFEQNNLLKELIRIFGAEYKERLKQLSIDISDSFFKSYGKPLSEINDYPVMSKINLSNLLYEPNDPNRVNLLLSPFKSIEEARKHINPQYLVLLSND